jgi:hypothetical protein
LHDGYLPQQGGRLIRAQRWEGIFPVRQRMRQKNNTPAHPDRVPPCHRRNDKNIFAKGLHLPNTGNIVTRIMRRMTVRRAFYP